MGLSRLWTKNILTFFEMNLTKDFMDFIELLNKHEVAYMVVGGYAVGFHGYPRYTGDLDVWIKRSEENVSKLMCVVKDFGGPHAEMNEGDLLREPSKENPSPGVGFGREPLRIEVLSAIEGVEFDDCIENVVEKAIGGVALKYIHYNDLKKNKLSTGRTKDRADIEELEKKRSA